MVGYRANLVAISLLIGCSSSEPSGAPASPGIDAGIDSESVDANDAHEASDAAPTCTIPAESNALSGVLSHGNTDATPAWTPKTVLRIDRATHPSNPRIMFFSTVVDCVTLMTDGWDGRIDPSTSYLSLELGAASTGSFGVVGEGSPPPPTGAYVDRGWAHKPSDPPLPTQYAKVGTVDVSSFDATGAKGTFTSGFVTVAGTPPVCGRFDAAPCSVDW